MIAPLVFVAMALDWWPRFMALADLLGTHVEPRQDGELVVYTGRNLAGAWVA